MCSQNFGAYFRRNSQAMLDEDFCSTLDFRLSDVFKASADSFVQAFWCDGVVMPDLQAETLELMIKKDRQITLKSFIGEDGQDEYQMTLSFGNKAYSRFVRGLEIQSCIPDPDDPGWISLDHKKKTIAVRLH